MQYKTGRVLETEAVTEDEVPALWLYTRKKRRRVRG
jgi:hypothetical protein